ncbi:MAG: F0F1 ATP synthase subunit delta [Candidatus Omnitrophica bacterium]|nr:F0F1 ATP synthase subunit delta [Candidatus Omnitrophota bacterium]
MFTLFMVFFGQCVFAVIVIFVLKKLLDKELMSVALEKFESCKISSDIKEINVYSASAISNEVKNHFESVRQRKMPQANLNFRENADLKGGLVIVAGDLLLDFSLFSRLQNFWA